jgi:hypothetical protein
MISNEVLLRYSAGSFTDGDVTRCTGLSVRGWRELIKIGAVRTCSEKRGPGRVRACDATTFKRAAIIAVLNQAGFSLALAGRMAYLLPLDARLYEIWDPCFILLDATATVEPETGLPPRLKVPKANWFDLDEPATADPENDWLIGIYNGRFVATVYGPERKPIIYGDIRSAATHFVAWYPFHRQHQLIERPTANIAREQLSQQIAVDIAKWEHPSHLSDRLDPRFLDYQYEDHGGDDDPLSGAAEAAVRSPLFTTTINVTLAIRKALRRYLGIDPALSDANILEIS